LAVSRFDSGTGLAMKVLVETDSDELHEQKKVDSRGRVTLGKEYADELVSVAVVGRDESE
jgi:hypothetical protein